MFILPLPDKINNIRRAYLLSFFQKRKKRNFEAKTITHSPHAHKIQCKKNFWRYDMSDLAATNCGGCNCNEGGGCGSILWIILLLCCCGGNGSFIGNGNNCGGGCGCGFGGNSECLWLILLLFCCGGNNGGCGCGCNNGSFC